MESVPPRCLHVGFMCSKQAPRCEGRATLSPGGFRGGPPLRKTKEETHKARRVRGQEKRTRDVRETYRNVREARRHISVKHLSLFRAGGHQTPKNAFTNNFERNPCFGTGSRFTALGEIIVRCPERRRPSCVVALLVWRAPYIPICMVPQIRPPIQVDRVGIPCASHTCHRSNI